MAALLIMVVAIGSFIGAVVLLWKSRTHSTRINLIRRAVPMKLSELGNAIPGQMVAVSGNAASERELISEQTQTACIYFDYSVDRQYQIGVTRERSSGHGQRTVKQQRRETVAHDEQWVPFHIRDESGQVGVNPEGAWFDSRQVMDSHVPATKENRDGLPGQKMTNKPSPGGTIGYTIVENVIQSGQPVFVVGPVNEQGQIEGNGRHGVIVSYRQGSALMDEMSNHSRTRLLGCFGFFVLGILAIVGGTVATAMSII